MKKYKNLLLTLIAIVLILLMIFWLDRLQHSTSKTKPAPNLSDPKTHIKKTIIKTITTPDTTNKNIIKAIGDAIIETVEPAISIIPKSNDTTPIAKSKHMIFTGITYGTKTKYMVEIAYLRRISKSNFYLTGGINIPIFRKDSIYNYSQFKLGITWKR